jgi:hypothetical protein
MPCLGCCFCCEAGNGVGSFIRSAPTFFFRIAMVILCRVSSVQQVSNYLFQILKTKNNFGSKTRERRREMTTTQRDARRALLLLLYNQKVNTIYLQY